MMKYLKFSFIFTLIIYFCFILMACSVSKQEMGVIINLSGKQRMLTQKMSKEILLIAKGINVTENKNNLRQTEIIFNRTLIGLLNGDSELGLVKIENPQIVQQLNKVAELWKVFRENVDTVLIGNTSITVLRNTAKQNMPLLKAMNKTVKMYERESCSTLEEWMAVTINLAGKQRMLTQKMTKELLLVAVDIEPKTNRARLAETVSLFERTLAGLLDGDGELGLPGTKNTAIRTQLMLVKKRWDEYKPILTKNRVSHDDLVRASQLNIPLLKEMDKAVRMYADSVK